MKVFFLESYGRGQQYGIGSYAGNLVSAMQHYDKTEFVYVHINAVTYKKITLETEGRVEHIYIPPPATLPPDIPVKDLFLTIQMAKGIYAILSLYFDNSGVNILHLNTPLQCNIGILAKEYGDCEVVYTMHILLWRVLYNSNRERFMQDWNALSKDITNEAADWMLKEKTLCQAAGQIICMTPEARDFTNKYYGVSMRKINIISNGISYDDIKPLPPQEKSLLKQELGFRPEDKLILWVGRLDEGKGLEFVLQAICSVIKEFPGIKLVIIGNGSFEYYLNYATSIWSYIIFTGYLSKDVLNRFYSMADMGILSSLNEQSSYVALEMMSRQLPVIASDIEGFKSVLKGEVSCLKTRVLVTGNSVSLDVVQLADNIKRLLSDKALGYALSRSARADIENNFNVGSMFKKLLTVYEKAASQLLQQVY